MFLLPFPHNEPFSGAILLCSRALASEIVISPAEVNYKGSDKTTYLLTKTYLDLIQIEYFYGHEKAVTNVLIAFTKPY